MANSSLKNPNQGDVHAGELFDLENRAKAPNIPADLATQDQRDAAIRDSGSNQDAVREQETSGSWANNVSKVSATRDKANKLRGKGRMTGGKRKKLLAGLGVGGGVAGIIALIMMILPLKLEMFAQNIMSNASKVSGYATEQRGKYLIKKAITDRIYQKGTGISDGETLMCKGGGIACSLFKTYTTDLIEKKFDLKFDKSGANGVKITRLSGIKRTWEIKSLSGDGYGEITKTLNETEMRNMLDAHINERVSKTGLTGWIARYIGRKVEMRKYGVRTWVGEKLAKPGEKLDDIRSKIRSEIIMNIFGRISARFGVWMACLDSPTTCSKAIDKLSPEQLKSFLSNGDLAKEIDKMDTKDMQKAVQEAMNKIMADLKAKLKVAKGWLIAILAIDLIAKIAVATSNGTVDKIVSDAVLGTYVMFGYGDNAGIFTNNEKLKAGDLDMANLEALSSMFDGAEKSPLMAYENGISNRSLATLFGGTTAFAAGSSSTSGVMCQNRFGQPDTPLPAGQLVCDNQKVNQNITTGASQFLNDSGLGTIADVWRTFPGALLDWAKDMLNGALSAIDPTTIVLDWSMEQLANSELGQNAMKQLSSFVTSSIITVPSCGMDATGDQNYTCFSGAGWAESNELAQNGQDPTDGTPNGNGGQYLTPTQVAAITKEQESNTPKPSYLASIFNPYVKGSLSQQFALLAPSSGTDLIGSLLNAPAAIMAGFGTQSFAASSLSSTVANNPFNQVMYGYPIGSSVFEADPGNYTADSCKAMADSRTEQSVDGVPYPVYTTTDPCALEKTVVGGLLADAGVTDDPNSLKDPLTTGTSGGGAASTAGATIDMAHIYEDSTSVACAAGTGTQLTFDETGYINGGAVPVKLCSLPNTSYMDSDQSWGPITVVNSRASGAFNSMLDAMRTDLGLSNIEIASSFRTYAMQQQMKAQYGGGAADPGYSNHQMGLALDFYDPSACSNSYGISSCPSSRIWNWLVANASRFGFSQYPPEWWHWSVDGK